LRKVPLREGRKKKFRYPAALALRHASAVGVEASAHQVRHRRQRATGVREPSTQVEEKRTNAKQEDQKEVLVEGGEKKSINSLSNQKSRGRNLYDLL